MSAIEVWDVYNAIESCQMLPLGSQLSPERSTWDQTHETDFPILPTPRETSLQLRKTVENRVVTKPIHPVETTFKARERVDLVKRFDRTFHREDTALAKLTKLISPKLGIEYVDSSAKRLFELSIAIPAAVVSLPASLVLGFIQRCCDGHEMFYKSPRMLDAMTGEEFEMLKIRTMAPGNGLTHHSPQLGSVIKDNHPGIVGIGKLLRRFKMDELPQFLHVIMGEMRLIGNRALPRLVRDYLEEHLTEDEFKSWCKNYRPGVTGPHQALNPVQDRDENRYRPEMFYAEHASLDFDLYLIWRTVMKMFPGTNSRKG